MGEEEQKEQTELLREIAKWMKFTGMKEVKGVLETALSTPAKKALYHNSDGIKTTRDLKEITSLGISTIVSCWDEWSSVGIIEKISVQRGERGKKCFSLEEFGIEIPQLSRTDTPTSSQEPLAEVEDKSQPRTEVSEDG